MNDKYFRVALLISVIVHLGLIIPLRQFNSSEKSFKNKIKRLELTYSQLREKPFLGNKLPGEAREEEITPKTEPVKAEKLRGLPTCISKRHSIRPIVKPIFKPETEKEIKKHPVKKETPVQKETTDKNEKIAEFKDLDAQEIPFFLDYYQTIREKIHRQTIYPDLARRNLTEGTTSLSFILADNGELKKVGIKKSSGNNLLDRTAVWFIKRASPFSPFPEALKQRQLKLSVQISYKLN